MRENLRPVVRLSRAIVAVSLLIMLGLGGVLAATDPGPRPDAMGPYDASTRTYRVAAGDNLTAIGRRFGITVAELTALNKLSGDAVALGRRLVVAAAGADVKGSKPNILFIVSDDTGFGDLGPYGGGEGRGMPTPNIDRLAADGMTFFFFLCTAELDPRPRGHADGTHSEPQRHDQTDVAARFAQPAVQGRPRCADRAADDLTNGRIDVALASVVRATAAIINQALANDSDEQLRRGRATLLGQLRHSPWMQEVLRFGEPDGDRLALDAVGSRLLRPTRHLGQRRDAGRLHPSAHPSGDARSLDGLRLQAADVLCPGGHLNHGCRLTARLGRRSSGKPALDAPTKPASAKPL